MTPSTTRALQRGLLALVVALVTAVAWSVRKPAPPAPGPEPPGAEGGAQATRVGELVLRRFKGENEGLVLKARAMVGQEGAETKFEGVDVELRYVARGEPGKARIRAERCRYAAAEERAAFQGSVHLSTEDGFELETETLVYNGKKGVARTADPARFKRKALSGSSTGLQYRAEEGRLELLADAFLRIEGESGPPTEVRARRAEASRERHELLFMGDVRVEQGSDTLKAGRLNLDLTDDLSAVYRAVAVEDVELRTAGKTRAPGAPVTAKARGPRVLKGRKLDVWFRDDHSLKEATAFPDADLLVLPGPGEPRERRRVRSRVLAFRFDEAGRLTELQAQRDAVVTAEPLEAGASPARTASAGNLIARLEPETGEVVEVVFEKGTEFKEGSRLGRGRSARYDGGRRVLVLEGEPELRDEAEGSELRAQTIEISEAGGDVKARQKVRHTRRASGAGGKRAFLSGQEATTVVVADALEYTAKLRRARYEGNALLRSGKDEVRSRSLVIEEPAPEKRRLEATGEVVSLLHPRAKPGDPKPPAAVEGRAQEMVYEEARREIVYKGDVTLRQGEIRTKSPAAVVVLTAEGDDLESLSAGEPAEIEQGQRRATGRRATYTPRTETVVVVGENAVLKDPDQQVEGRTLTFHVGDDTILVNGQEQVRTEAVIRRQPRSP